MQCHQCNAPVDAEARFCPDCGAPLKEAGNKGNAPNVTAEPEAAASSEQLPLQTMIENKTGTSGPGTASSTDAGSGSDFVKKLESTSKDYFGFIKACLASPTTHSRSVNGDNMVNGIINMVLLCLFLATIFSKFIYTLFYGIVAPLSDPFGILRQKAPSLMDTFVQPLLLFLILMAIVVAAIYLACKLMQSESDWKDIVARFGAFLGVPTALFLLTAFFSLIEAYGLTALLMTIALFAFCTAITLTLYSLKRPDAKGLDPVYGVLVAYVITGVGYYLLSKILI